MTNKKINDFNPISALALDTNFEVQDAVGGPGSSKKASGQQIVDLVESALTTPANVRYVATDGDDSTGDGSFLRPWATLPYAYSQITDATVVNTYKIEVLNGAYSWPACDTKPFIVVDFNQSQITIAATVAFDSVAWAVASGFIVWQNCYSSNFNINFDLSVTLSGGFNVIKLKNCLMNNNANSWLLFGSPTNTNYLLLDQVVGIDTGINVSVYDCNVNSNNCNLNSYLISNLNSVVFNTIQSNKIANLTTQCASNNILQVDLNSTIVWGTATFENTSSGNTVIVKTDSPFYNGPIINAGISTIQIRYDYLNTESTITGNVMRVPLIPPLNWTKFETYGTAITNTSVTSDTVPVPLDVSGADFNNITNGFGLTVDVFGSVQNTTGTAGWFNIRSTISYVGVTAAADFVLAHVYGPSLPTTIYDPSKVQTSSILPILGDGGRVTATVESDIYLNNNDYVQLQILNVAAAASNTLRVISLTTRACGNG